MRVEPGLLDNAHRARREPIASFAGPQAGAIPRLPPLCRSSVCQPHFQVGNLAFLSGDDLFRHASQHWVLAVLQFDLSHVDGAGMMGDHHGGKVMVGLAAHGRVHVPIYLLHANHVSLRRWADCLAVHRDRRMPDT